MARGRALPRLGTELVGWWAALVGVWLITLSSVSMSELAVSIGCGLPCAIVAVAARRAIRARWSPRLRWAGWLVPLAAAVVADMVRVLTIPPRRALRGQGWEGEIRETSLPAGEPAATSAARRALATLVLSATPATFVIDTDPRKRRLVVHSLVQGHSPMERVISR